MAERANLDGSTPPILVSKKCPRVTRSSLGCEVQSGNVADEDSAFLRLASPEMMKWWISAETHQGGFGGYFRLPTDWKGLNDSL